MTGADSGEIVLEDVEIRYGAAPEQYVVACRDLSLRVGGGEFVVLIGRSGCGKTSVLHAIDGLVPYSAGRILVDGKLVTGPGRDRAMVFQSPTLLPWRRVIDNVTYGREITRGKSEAREHAMGLLRLVGLEGFEGAWPRQLSGGMRQRVNLARALAVEPDVLLLDEPFSALDAQTREQMQSELLRIRRERKDAGRLLTMVFVTHDIHEAVYLADRVIALTPRPGRVLAEITIDLGRPREKRVRETRVFQDYVGQMRDLLD